MTDDLFKESDCDGNLLELTNYAIRGERAISLDKANRIHREWLSKGTVVYANKNENTGFGVWASEDKDLTYDTHTAILVCVKPIEPADSAERVLEDWLRWRDDPLRYGHEGIQEVEQRARKLLSKRGENDRT